MKAYIKKIFQRKDVTGLSILGHGHHFDWKMLLSTFLLVVVLILLFSVHIFLGVRAGDIFSAEGPTSIPPMLINRDGLDKVIKNFDIRSQNLKALEAQKPVLVDPSL